MRLTLSSHVVWRDVPGELVLFDRRNEGYHALSEIAAVIWRRMSVGLTICEIVEMLAAHHAVLTEVVARDVADFVTEARAKGLLIDAEEPE